MNNFGTRTNSSSLDLDTQSTMDNGRRHHHRKTLAKVHSLTTTATASHCHAANIFNGNFVEAEGDNDSDDECSQGGDSEMWTNFNHSFQQVQSVLDRNRVLIQKVNDNHQSKIHDNLVQNVSLINEINGNITKVVSLYSDLSVNFSNVVHQRDSPVQSKSNSGKSGS